MKTYSLEQFCKEAGLSRRTVSRRIKSGSIKPIIIKSKQGTKEYRFTTNHLFDNLEERTVNVCVICGNKTETTEKQNLKMIFQYLSARINYLIDKELSNSVKNSK